MFDNFDKYNESCMITRIDVYRDYSDIGLTTSKLATHLKISLLPGQ